jgi:TPR repeat protein
MQKAFEMYMELAHNYEERACFKIGQFYENGEVVEKDLKKAGLWYWRATRRTSKEISDKFNSFFN